MFYGALPARQSPGEYGSGSAGVNARRAGRGGQSPTCVDSFHGGPIGASVPRMALDRAKHLPVLALFVIALSACGGDGGGGGSRVDGGAGGGDGGGGGGSDGGAETPSVICQQDVEDGEVCFFPTQSCCFSFAGVNCIGLDDACEGPGGTPAARLDCDGREDCGPGEYCCDKQSNLVCLPEGSCDQNAFLCNGPNDCPASVPQCCDGLCTAQGTC